MPISREYLTAEVEDFKSQLEKLKQLYNKTAADINVVSGAVQFGEQLLAFEAKEQPPADPPEPKEP